MGYEILQVAGSDAFLLRSHEQHDNALEVPSLRDLLLLRARLDRYINELSPDGMIPGSYAKSTPVQANNDVDLITVSQAFDIAEAQGYQIPPTSLKSAVYRGTIPGAVQQGTRWRMPRSAFEEWLQQWAASQ